MGGRITEHTRTILAAAALLAIGAFLYVALSRMSFPYELEWIEGGMLEETARVGDGEALYVEPSVDYTPLLYGPLYVYVCAGLAEVFGLSLTLMRAVSVASSLVAFGFAFALVARETGSRRAGLLAAGLFAGCYEIAGSWLDLARVDALFLGLLMAAVYAARFAETRRRAAAAGVLLVLAALAKQQALVVAPALALSLFLRGRGVGAAFSVAFAVPFVAITGAAEAASDGWYRYFVFELAGQHAIVREYLHTFFTDDLAKAGVMAALAAAALWVWVRERRRDELVFYAGLGVTLIGGAYVSRIHEGGVENVVLPAYLFLALVGAIGAHLLLVRSPWPRATPVAVGVAVLVQFAIVVYNPTRLVPDSGDESSGDRTVAALRALEGDVYAPAHLTHLREADRPRHAHAQALSDVLRADDSDARRKLSAELEALVEGGCFDFIVGDPSAYGLFRLDGHYRFARPLLPGGEQSFVPVTGFPATPRDIYRPVPPRRCGDG